MSHRRIRYSALGLSAGIFFWSLTVTAAAAQQVGIYVEGPDSSLVRDALAAAAPKGVAVVDPDTLAFALVSDGHSSLVKRLEGKLRDDEVRHVREVAVALHLDGVLLGRVRREGTKRRIHLLVIDRTGGEDDLRDVLWAPGDDAANAALLARSREAFEPYAEAAEPPSPADGERGAQPSAEPHAAHSDGPAEEPRDAIDRRPPAVFNRSLLAVEIGGDAVGRHFEYTDGVSNNLRPYDVAPAAMVSASAAVFPLAGASGFVRDIGVIGGYSRSLFLHSALAGSQDLSTVESAYSVGLRVRIHPWGDDGTLFGVSDEYAAQSFVFASAGASMDSQVPSVDYRANRTAVEVRVPLGRFALLGGVGFRAVFDAGAVASRFRSPTVDGIDAEAGASFTVAPGWEARALLDYERYFYSFQPIPGDGYVAGGALDQFFGARLALAYIF